MKSSVVIHLDRGWWGKEAPDGLGKPGAAFGRACEALAEAQAAMAAGTGGAGAVDEAISAIEAAAKEVARTARGLEKKTSDAGLKKAYKNTQAIMAGPLEKAIAALRETAGVPEGAAEAEAAAAAADPFATPEAHAGYLRDRIAALGRDRVPFALSVPSEEPAEMRLAIEHGQAGKTLAADLRTRTGARRATHGTLALREGRVLSLRLDGKPVPSLAKRVALMLRRLGVTGVSRVAVGREGMSLGEADTATEHRLDPGEVFGEAQAAETPSRRVTAAQDLLDRYRTIQTALKPALAALPPEARAAAKTRIAAFSAALSQEAGDIAARLLDALRGIVGEADPETPPPVPLPPRLAALAGAGTATAARAAARLSGLTDDEIARMPDAADPADAAEAAAAAAAGARAAGTLGPVAGAATGAEIATLDGRTITARARGRHAFPLSAPAVAFAESLPGAAGVIAEGGLWAVYLVDLGPVPDATDAQDCADAPEEAPRLVPAHDGLLAVAIDGASLPVCTPPTIADLVPREAADRALAAAEAWAARIADDPSLAAPEAVDAAGRALADAEAAIAADRARIAAAVDEAAGLFAGSGRGATPEAAVALAGIRARIGEAEAAVALGLARLPAAAAAMPALGWADRAALSDPASRGAALAAGARAFAAEVALARAWVEDVAAPLPGRAPQAPDEARIAAVLLLAEGLPALPAAAAMPDAGTEPAHAA